MSVYVHGYLHIEHINSFKGTAVKWEPAVFGMLKHTLLAQQGLVWGASVSPRALLDDTNSPLKQHTSRMHEDSRRALYP